jgi:PPOX class probable F420-dependent enzyme
VTQPEISEKVRAFLARPNPAVIATVRPDGQPISVATWYVLDDDGRILVNMDEGRKRLQYLRHDPRVSLTVLAEKNWYSHVSIQGVASELIDDRGLTDIDRLSKHYLGKPYPNRQRKRVSAYITVQHVHTWGHFNVRA